MPANTQGRIQTWVQETKAAADAAEAVYQKEEAEADAASDEKWARRAELRDYEDKRAQFRKKYGQQINFEGSIRGQIATVENIGLLKTSIHDSVGLGTRIIGMATGPLAGLINAGVGQASTALRGTTTTGLVGLIPGSNANFGSALDVRGAVGTVGTAAGAANNLGQLQGLAPNARLGAIGNLADSFELGHDIGQLAQGQNVFRSAAPEIGNVFALDNDQLRSLADTIENEWDPGFLEKLNGLDNEELAGDLRNLADAREEAAVAGDNLRGAARDAEAASAQADEAYEKERAEADQARDERSEALSEYIEARIAAAKAGIMVDLS